MSNSTSPQVADVSDLEASDPSTVQVLGGLQKRMFIANAIVGVASRAVDQNADDDLWRTLTEAHDRLQEIASELSDVVYEMEQAGRESHE